MPQFGHRTEEKNRPHTLHIFALRGTSAPQLSQKNFAFRLSLMMHREEILLADRNNRCRNGFYAAVSFYADGSNLHAV